MAVQETGSELQSESDKGLSTLARILFNIFLERIMCDALDDHENSVSIGGWLITNVCCADDIVINEEDISW